MKMALLFGVSAFSFLIACAPAVASESPQTYTGVSPAVVDEYSRNGTTISLTATNAAHGANATALVRCGTPTQGRWAADATNVTGTCWDINFCYDVASSAVEQIKATALAGKTITAQTIKAGTGGAVTNLCYQIKRDATPADILVEETSHCTPDQYTGPIEDGVAMKPLCIWDEQTPTQIVNNMDDDMYRLDIPLDWDHGNGAYIENPSLGGTDDIDRLKWVERVQSGDDRGLMIPSGPWVGSNAFTDYRDFMNNAPAEHVKVESACYPSKLTLCADEPPAQSPPTPGVCGAAHGAKFASVTEIPPGDRCWVGVPSSIQTVGGGYQWSCEGIPNSQATAQCAATVPPPKEGTPTPATAECFFQMSGFPINHTTSMGQVSSSIVGVGARPGAEVFLGEGHYRKMDKETIGIQFPTYRKGVNVIHAMNGIALGRDTRVTIYSGPNFSGSVMFDRHGPLIMNERDFLKNNPSHPDWSYQIRNDFAGGTVNEENSTVRRRFLAFPATAREWAGVWQLSDFAKGGSVKVDCGGLTHTMPPQQTCPKYPHATDKSVVGGTNYCPLTPVYPEEIDEVATEYPEYPEYPECDAGDTSGECGGEVGYDE